MKFNIRIVRFRMEDPLRDTDVFHRVSSPAYAPITRGGAECVIEGIPRGGAGEIQLKNTRRQVRILAGAVSDVFGWTGKIDGSWLSDDSGCAGIIADCSHLADS